MSKCNDKLPDTSQIAAVAEARDDPGVYDSDDLHVPLPQNMVSPGDSAELERRSSYTQYTNQVDESDLKTTRWKREQERKTERVGTGQYVAGGLATVTDGSCFCCLGCAQCMRELADLWQLCLVCVQCCTCCCVTVEVPT